MLHYTHPRSSKLFATSVKSRTSVNRIPVFSRRALSRAAWVALIGSFALEPVSADVNTEAARQLEFGVEMALKGSWREAAFRFEKAVRADDRHAGAFNDLAVALETLGEYESAREAYERALALAPDNERIRANYDLFMNLYKLHGRSSGDS